MLFTPFTPCSKFLAATLRTVSCLQVQYCNVHSARCRVSLPETCDSACRVCHTRSVTNGRCHRLCAGLSAANWSRRTSRFVHFAFLFPNRPDILRLIPQFANRTTRRLHDAFIIYRFRIHPGRYFVNNRHVANRQLSHSPLRKSRRSRLSTRDSTELNADIITITQFVRTIQPRRVYESSKLEPPIPIDCGQLRYREALDHLSRICTTSIVSHYFIDLHRRSATLQRNL